MPRSNEVVAGRFRLVRELGKGGMGAVWLAHHLALDNPCAVKFILEDGALDEGRCARFEREAKAAARLQSPHVVQMLDHGIWEGHPYIAMELLRGEDLAARLAREGRLSAEATVTLLTQVGRALTRAHAAGVVHRDMKPENVFLVRDDDREIAKVLDFGIAKTTTTGLDEGAKTRTGALLGTPLYMSPEQAGSGVVDHRADLWALAVMAFQCVTGRPPFDGAALGELFMRIMVEPLPVPSTLAPGLPPAFDVWWARAAARPVGDRFQSAKELTDALALALGVGEAEDGRPAPLVLASAPPRVAIAVTPAVQQQSRTELSLARTLDLESAASGLALRPRAPPEPERSKAARSPRPVEAAAVAHAAAQPQPHQAPSVFMVVGLVKPAALLVMGLVIAAALVVAGMRFVGNAPAGPGATAPVAVAAGQPPPQAGDAREPAAAAPPPRAPTLASPAPVRASESATAPPLVPPAPVNRAPAPAPKPGPVATAEAPAPPPSPPSPKRPASPAAEATARPAATSNPLHEM